MLVLVAAGLGIAACHMPTSDPPGLGPGPGPGMSGIKLSGAVVDAGTGAGISGAEVELNASDGLHKSVTDASGNYTISSSLTGSTVSGDLTVFKDSTYTFRLYQGAVLQGNTATTMNFALTSVLATTSHNTITGKIYDSAGSELSGTVVITLVNSSGTFSWTPYSGTYTAGGAGYGAIFPTVSDCTVYVLVNETSPNPRMVLYDLSGQSFTGNGTLNLTLPAASLLTLSTLGNLSTAATELDALLATTSNPLDAQMIAMPFVPSVTSQAVQAEIPSGTTLQWRMYDSATKDSSFSSVGGSGQPASVSMPSYTTARMTGPLIGASPTYAAGVITLSSISGATSCVLGLLKGAAPRGWVS